MSTAKQEIVSLERAWLKLMRTMSVTFFQEKAAFDTSLQALNSLQRLK